MKIKLLLLLLFSLFNNVTAQNFSQEFHNNSTLIGNKYGIEHFDNGYSLCIAQVEDGNNFRKKIKLITTNLEGIIQGTKIYETEDGNFSISCSQIINAADGKQLISGTFSGNNSSPYAPFIMELNRDGSVNWAKKIISNRESPPKIIALSDGTFALYFAYVDDATQNVFCKLDSNGNFSSFKKCNSLNYGDIIDTKTYENSFEVMLITGNLINISNDLSTVNWQRKYYHSIGITYNRANNGDYIFAAAQVAIPGYMTVFRPDPDGNLRWAKYIESWRGANQNQSSIFDIVGFNFIKEDSNGNIITSADSEGGQVGSFNVVLNADGNYITNSKINTTQNKTLLLDNDNFIIGGFTAYASSNSNNFILENRNLINNYECDENFSFSIVDGTDMQIDSDLLVFTDSDFLTEGFNVTSTSEIITQNDYCNLQLSSVENIKLTNQVHIYPNPSNSEIWIESIDPITRISLHNALGQEIYSTNKSNINIENYSNGIYFLKITTQNNQSEVKKIIKN